MELARAIHEFLTAGRAFVSYRLPGQLLPKSAFEVELVETPPKDTPVFVISPFDENDLATSYFILKDVQEGFSVKIKDKTFKSSIGKGEKPKTAVELWQHAAYMKTVTDFIEKLKQNHISKLVISRIQPVKLPSHKSWGDVYLDLCARYPDAFVYCLSDGDQQQWMGASPELLLHVMDGQAETMALASTQAVDGRQADEMQWGEKEIDEHAYVIWHIREQLRSLGIVEIEESEVYTALVGPVAHLKADFNFRLPAAVNVDMLAKAIHPTPAVCGVPTNEAKQLIQQAEPHRRLYYTGFLGMRYDAHNADYYVNLRCMQVKGNTAYLYVGGGVTAASDAQKEWEETVLKTSVLSSVIAK